MGSWFDAVYADKKQTNPMLGHKRAAFPGRSAGGDKGSRRQVASETVLSRARKQAVVLNKRYWG
jgi:hypothetical protein